MKQHYCIVNDTVKDNLIAYIRTLPVNPRAPMVVEAREETRTDKQNRLMWPLLKDLSDQVVWHGEKLTREEWKDLITVLVNQTQDQEQKSAPGINGGRVYFGVRTSKSSKRYMVDVIEAIYWFGTDRGVKFSEASSKRIAWRKSGGRPVGNPLARVITNEIFRVPARRQRKAAVKPSDIPTLKDYTARLVDQKWLRLAARRSHA
ncbi:TPA: recombination protein NinB [Enterobacter ludwigii]|nr:recombination protein NinB [Enterobacter ludwigii]SAB65029.1 NinB family protein [Enterobacter ludwigii]HDR2561476.1 recombination protein NinB [Enterobacter ludwigii]HDR2580738.1 recombination protein NinB [Enterobacter ludwigii]